MSSEKSVARAIRAIAITLFVQLLICRPLWVSSGRMFPLIPPIGFIHIHWGNTIEALLYTIMLAGCIGLSVKPFKRIFLCLLILAFALLFVEDINRLQPWLYLYLLMLSSLFMFSIEQPEKVLLVFRLVLSSVYIWSGLQKINAHFPVDVFPWMFDFTGLEQFFAKHHSFAYASAILESLAGICLWLPKFRRGASIFLIVTHLAIIFSLGPFHHNWNIIVWPWNILFGWLIFELFYRSQPTPETVHQKQNRLSLFHLAAISVFIFVMPLLGFLGKCDHFLSDDFYSAMLNEPILYLPTTESDRLPSQSAPHQYLLSGSSITMLYFDSWSFDELKVPIYPQNWVYKAIAVKLSLMIKDTDNPILGIKEKTRFSEYSKEYFYLVKALKKP